MANAMAVLLTDELLIFRSKNFTYTYYPTIRSSDSAASIRDELNNREYDRFFEIADKMLELQTTLAERLQATFAVMGADMNERSRWYQQLLKVLDQTDKIMDEWR
ncbi:MAG: hypothetical protein Q9184_005712, partial [Pyrenodesmia sp. 2 TL-2023]